MLVACMALSVAPFCAFAASSSVGTSIQASTTSQATATAQAPATAAAYSDINMALVFDVSGSMDEPSALSGYTKLQSAKKQVSDFVRTVSSAAAGSSSSMVGVVSFSDNGKVESALSGNVDQISAAVNDMKTGNMTNMYEGLELGIDMLQQGQAAAKVLVLLSDGMNNQGHSEAEIQQLADQAAKDGIVIYTIGFGAASNLDESLLKYLANQTGGEYAHEDSSDIYSAALGIFAMMTQAEMKAAGQQVIAQSTGAVAQGETREINPIEMPANGTLTTYLYWPGSVLTMQFVDPNNVTVTPDYPGYTIDDSAIPTKIVIEDAMAGTWTASVTGVSVSMTQEPFYALSAFAQSVVLSGGGGGPVGGGMILVFMIAIVGIGAVLLTYAMSKRKTS